MAARLSPFVFPTIPGQKPFSQKDWLLGTAAIPAITLRTWTWQYNPNLIGQDLFPTGTMPGEASYNLPPGQLPSWLRQNDLGNWIWRYNLNLIGQDKFPPGIESTALVTKPYEYHTQLRTWTWNYNPNLIGQDQLPKGEQVFALPSGPDYSNSLRTWTQNLLENTLAPPPIVVNYQPRAPIYTNPRDPRELRSWVGTPPPPPTQNPFYQTNWPLPVGAQPIQQSITVSYNLNLIGQDQLPVGKIIYERPPLAPALLQTWVSTTNLPLTALAQNPFYYQYSWALPATAPQPDRSFTVSYNLNLIGQDQLPTGKQTSELVPRPYPEPATRTWTWWYNLNLIGQDKLATGKQVYDLTPIAQPQILPRSWTWSYNLNLIGQDKLPTGIQVTDLPPRAPQQPTTIFTATYNKNLIGQDQLPTGAKITDLPPQPPLSAIQLRTWIQSVNLALVGGPPPFRQTYWPINIGPQQPIQTFAASFNKNLIGQDKLPVGKTVYDLPPSGPAPLFQTWLQGFNQLRQGIIVQLPFNQYDWPVPRGAWDGRDRTIAARSQFLTPPAPPPERPNIERPYVRDWWDSDEWGNIYPGSGIRRG